MESANEKLGLPRNKMKKVIVAFDVDGTLIDLQGNPNERIVELLRTLSSFKNTHIIVWSGGGAEYAERRCRELGIERRVDSFMSKVSAHMQGFKPDIAIDDIQDTALGVVNLIVREK